jgi:hypothetical protein
MSTTPLGLDCVVEVFCSMYPVGGTLASFWLSKSDCSGCSPIPSSCRTVSPAVVGAISCTCFGLQSSEPVPPEGVDHVWELGNVPSR